LIKLGDNSQYAIDYLGDKNANIQIEFQGIVA
jgi:hypothetical protein